VNRIECNCFFPESECSSLVMVWLGFGLCSGLRLGSGWLGSGFGLGLDLHSWLLTHSRRSDAINFLLAYCQITDLTLSPSILIILLYARISTLYVSTSVKLVVLCTVTVRVVEWLVNRVRELAVNPATPMEKADSVGCMHSDRYSVALDLSKISKCSA